MVPCNHILLLTGPPRVGKTTVVRRVAERIAADRVLGGFVTEEVCDGRGRRQGFRAVCFDGGGSTISHMDIRGRPRVGKYGVAVDAVDALAGSLLENREEVDVYLIDEIGKMECLSTRFVAAMRELLDSAKPVVATVGLRGSGFIAEVKQRRDVELWEVRPDNRDRLPDAVLQWLAGLPGPSAEPNRSG